MNTFLRILSSLMAIMLFSGNSGCQSIGADDISTTASVSSSISATLPTEKVAQKEETKKKKQTTQVPETAITETVPAETKAPVKETQETNKKSPVKTTKKTEKVVTKSPESTPKETKPKTTKPEATKPKDTKATTKAPEPKETQAYKIPKTGPYVNLTANLGSINVGEMTTDLEPIKIKDAEDYYITKVVIHNGIFIERYKDMKKKIKIKVVEFQDTEFRIETNMAGLYYYTIYLQNPAGDKIVLKNAQIRVDDYATPGFEKEFTKEFNKTYKP